MSGTTLTSVIVSGLEIFTCNVGDSRIISVSMMSESQVGHFNVTQLTKDHKPEDD